MCCGIVEVGTTLALDVLAVVTVAVMSIPFEQSVVSAGDGEFRSDAKFSSPAMMDIVVDSYRRLIQIFGSVVLGVADEDFERVLTNERGGSQVATDAD